MKCQLMSNQNQSFWGTRTYAKVLEQENVVLYFFIMMVLSSHNDACSSFSDAPKR